MVRGSVERVRCRFERRAVVLCSLGGVVSWVWGGKRGKCSSTDGGNESGKCTLR